MLGIKSELKTGGKQVDCNHGFLCHDIKPYTFHLQNPKLFASVVQVVG